MRGTAAVAAPVAVPAPVPPASGAGRRIPSLTGIPNNPGLTPTTGLVQSEQFSTAGRTTPGQDIPVKRVSWHSSLGKFKGYGSVPPTRVGFSDPASECCDLFEQMQSEYAALCKAKRWARMVANFKPGITEFPF